MALKSTFGAVGKAYRGLKVVLKSALFSPKIPQRARPYQNRSACGKPTGEASTHSAIDWGLCSEGADCSQLEPPEGVVRFRRDVGWSAGFSGNAGSLKPLPDGQRLSVEQRLKYQGCTTWQSPSRPRFTTSLPATIQSRQRSAPASGARLRAPSPWATAPMSVMIGSPDSARSISSAWPQAGSRARSFPAAPRQ